MEEEIKNDVMAWKNIKYKPRFYHELVKLYGSGFSSKTENKADILSEQFNELRFELETTYLPYLKTSHGEAMDTISQLLGFLREEEERGKLKMIL